MDKLRIGVAGVGHLGKWHAANLNEIAQTELVGVYDTHKEVGEQIASENGVKHFISLAEMLTEVDAVDVVVPTSAHYETASQSLEAGKHVFIEKPITGTLEEAEKLICLAEEKKLKIQVGHIERFNPAFVSLEGFNFQPMFIESHRLAKFNPRGMDVSVVLDLMIHDIDAVLSMVRSPIKNTDASGANVVGDKADIANARIQFENGAIANITASRISQKNMRKMRIFQKNHYITIDFLEKVSEVFTLISNGEEFNGIDAILIDEPEYMGRKKKVYMQRPVIKESNALKVELAEFADSIIHDKEVKVTAEDGRRALEVAFDVIDKIDKTKRV
ncbi:Gfo/Idh/MocA family protein [candidate division KSB1 bacterium]